MFCPRHKVDFVRIPSRGGERGKQQRAILCRCPTCVEEARVKIILEQARFARCQPGGFAKAKREVLLELL